MSQAQIALFIPTYNVEATIAQVLSHVPQAAWARIKHTWIIDNGSQDQTVAMAEDFFRHNPSLPVTILKNQANHLLGGSTIVAFRECLARQLDWVICLHSDGQADANDLRQFFKFIDTNEYDIVSGSRLLPESRVAEYSNLRLLGNKFLAWFQKRILKQEVHDIASFLAFNLNTIKRVPFDRIPHDMSYHPLLILNFSRLDKRPLRIAEFPIHWGAVEHSNINPWVYTLKHLARMARLSLFGTQLLPKSPTLNSNVIYEQAAR